TDAAWPRASGDGPAEGRAGRAAGASSGTGSPQLQADVQARRPREGGGCASGERPALDRPREGGPRGTQASPDRDRLDDCEPVEAGQAAEADRPRTGSAEGSRLSLP